MERITGTFRNEEQAERVLEALEEAGFSNDVLETMLRQHAEVVALEDDEHAGAMIVVQAEEGAQADKARTILNAAGAMDIHSVDHSWDPDPEWRLGHLGRPTNA